MAKGLWLPRCSTILLLKGLRERLTLSHGDALCVADPAFRPSARQVRSADWQQGFLAQPLADRLAIAHDNTPAQRVFTAGRATPGSTWTRKPHDALRRGHALLHGHASPGEHGLGDGHGIVLSGWDQLAASPRTQCCASTCMRPRSPATAADPRTGLSGERDDDGWSAVGVVCATACAVR